MAALLGRVGPARPSRAAARRGAARRPLPPSVGEGQGSEGPLNPPPPWAAPVPKGCGRTSRSPRAGPGGLPLRRPSRDTRATPTERGKAVLSGKQGSVGEAGWERWGLGLEAFFQTPRLGSQVPPRRRPQSGGPSPAFGHAPSPRPHGAETESPGVARSGRAQDTKVGLDGPVGDRVARVRLPTRLGPGGREVSGPRGASARHPWLRHTRARSSLATPPPTLALLGPRARSCPRRIGPSRAFERGSSRSRLGLLIPLFLCKA